MTRLDDMELGGIRCRLFDVSERESVFADNPDYGFRMFCLQAGEQREVLLSARSCLVSFLGNPCNVQVTGLSAPFKPGDAVELYPGKATFRASDQTAILLLASQQEGDAGMREPALICRDRQHWTEKPWGYEVWFTREGWTFHLKEIFLKQGTRSSLQYHRQKQETLVLFTGESRLYYKGNARIANDAMDACHVSTHELTPIASLDIPPGTVHRVEAITDLLLYEVATVHPDDIHRIQDDTQRKN